MSLEMLDDRAETVLRTSMFSNPMLEVTLPQEMGSRSPGAFTLRISNN